MNDSGENRNQEICRLLRSGDQRGMELLFDVYYKSLVVWADTFLRDMNMAEDVVQDFSCPCGMAKLIRDLSQRHWCLFFMFQYEIDV